MSRPTNKPIPACTDRDVARFANRLVRQGDCLIWTGAKKPSKRGVVTYGLFYFGKKRYVVSRVAYFVATGKDPGPYDVCHTCDNGLCCEPGHLFLGEQDDNNKDRAKKGRYDNHGRKNPNVKLTEENVVSILASNESDRILADRFNVSPGAIWFVRKGRKGGTWRKLLDNLPTDQTGH